MNFNPFISAQVQAAIESVRLLEASLSSSLDLHSDLRMIRESLPFPEAAAQAQKAALRDLTSRPLELALDTIGHLRMSLDILEKTEGVSQQWIDRAREVLSKAEQGAAGELRRSQACQIRGLYVIVDPGATLGRPVLEVAEAILEGGTKVLQLRDKTGDKGDVLEVARQLLALCEQHKAIFIVNDHADLALACGAHGLHVGQHDLPIAEARRVLRPLQLVGRSNATVEEALESHAQGAGYVAVGSIFPTATKDNTRPAGLETLKRVKELVDLPVVAIGGISESNVEKVIESGADCVCVISAVCMADSPKEAAERMVEGIESAKAKVGRP